MFDAPTLPYRADHAVTAFAKACAELPLLDEGSQLLDDDTVAKIHEIGVHPFVLVCVEGDSDQDRHWLICQTENDLPKFVDELARLPMLGECNLLRGFERALRLETYEAAECWFSWVKQAPLGRAEIVRLGLPLSASLGSYYGYPIFDVSSAAASDNEDLRLKTLSTLFEAYLATDGNNAARIRLVEALAFALSRCLGARGEYHEASWIVDCALQLWPSSIHLKAARHALGLQLDGKMVPDRLVKFIGEDNGYLKQFVCPLPFEHFEISPSGEVLVCCGHWLPTSIGNFMKDPIDGILNSARAQKICELMTDGSYKYCNHLDCGAMI